MKRIIILVLILVSIPFLMVNKESISQQVEQISQENSKNPETANWEYLKDRAFDENDNLNKGYSKPVVINLNEGTTIKDSLIVDEFIKNLKNLIPSIEIGFESYDGYSPPFHSVNLTFGRKPLLTGRFEKRDLEDGTTILRAKPGFVTSSDSSRYSLIDFDFKNDISDQDRKIYIESELWNAIFATKSTNKPYNKQFYVQRFNPSTFDYSYGFLGNKDKFLLQKLYAGDFKSQFGEYMNQYYPWRYATYFLNKDLARFDAVAIVGLIGIVFFILIFSLFQNKKFKYSYLNYFLPILCIWLYFSDLTLLYRYLTDFHSILIWDDMAFGLIILFAVSAISSFLLWFLEKFFIKENTAISLKLALKTVFTFLIFCLPILTSFFLGLYKEDVINYFLSQLLFFVILALGRGFLIYLNHIAESLVKQKDVELSHLKEVNAQSELKLLQSHINPHFLYNALNSIAGLAHDDSDKTEKMALSLSDLFRYSINKKGKKMSTVNEEVTLVENYLEIEKIRFGERLVFTLTIDAAVKEEKIPMFMLQPLLENAIKHGVSKIGGEAKVSLAIKKDHEGLLIVVRDNGPDFPKGLVSGHGLQTVYDLLRLSYGKNASISWENTPKKQIVITIQKNK